MKRLLALVLLVCGAAAGQVNLFSVGAKESAVFVQGGHSVSGGSRDMGTLAAGFRFGYGFLRVPGGTMDYTVEFIPVEYFWQQRNAYGASFTPFNLKYNLTHFRRMMPYAELGGGVLFTNNDVPDRISTINFTPQAGIGVQIPIHPGSNKHIGIALKYMHVSNAGLMVPNPGLNTVQVQLSFGHFCSKHGAYDDQTPKCGWIHH